MKSNKTLYILTIVAGSLLVLGAICIMIFTNMVKNNSEGAMGTLDFILIGAGSLFSLSGFIVLFVLIVKILKEKKII